MPQVELPSPCRARQVLAILTALDGRVYIGSNGVERPQTVCPRKVTGLDRGAGWDLCRTICGQICHAEVAAIKDAGTNAAGGILYLIGHDTICEQCKEILDVAGIEQVVIVG